MSSRFTPHTSAHGTPHVCAGAASARWHRHRPAGSSPPTLATPASCSMTQPPTRRRSCPHQLCLLHAGMTAANCSSAGSPQPVRAWRRKLKISAVSLRRDVAWADTAWACCCVRLTTVHHGAPPQRSLLPCVSCQGLKQWGAWACHRPL
jgi:hypothetical protein